jgi:TolA-binding protein
MRSPLLQVLAVGLTSSLSLARPAAVRAQATSVVQSSEATIQQQLSQAAELVNRGEYATAEPALRAIVDSGDRSAPTTASALHLLGVVDEDVQRYGDAEKHYLRALRIWDALGPRRTRPPNRIHNKSLIPIPAKGPIK